LFKFPNILKTLESLRLPKALKLMAQKESRAALHHKGLEPKKQCSEARRPNKFGLVYQH
jgi:hypothetical protein